MLRLAREAGCCLMSSGYESVNQGSLDAQRKRATAAEYKRRIKAIQDEGMIASGNFMFGFDDDDVGTFERTLEFLDGSGMLHSNFTTEIPFPGTAAHRRYDREGRLLTRDYDDYVGKGQIVVKPARMTPRELEDGIRWLALSYYSPRRAAQRARVAYDNKRLFSELVGGQRAAAIVGLSAYQVYQWHYRMTKVGYGLYQRMLPWAKYSYPAEWVRRSDFERDRAPAPS
ncbi:MAG: hypothetical protein JNL79_31265 [Myxococcales bacterium]|nr:hypothetical protein [Myxococcales bacterium]